MQVLQSSTEQILQGLKRKISWHADQLARESCKVAALTNAVRGADEEVAQPASLRKVKVPCRQDIRCSSAGANLVPIHDHKQHEWQTPYGAMFDLLLQKIDSAHLDDIATLTWHRPVQLEIQFC